MSAIPKEHVDEVCKPGQQDGTTCAFLTLAFADISSRGTWFDRDPGDCVRITDVSVE